MLKLKLQYFGHPMGRANSLEKTLMLGKIEDTEALGCCQPRATFCCTSLAPLSALLSWLRFVVSSAMSPRGVLLKPLETLVRAVALSKKHSPL